MSKVMTFGKPASVPMRAPPMTPPAGPDWHVRAGVVRAAAALVTPPPEWMIRMSPREPHARGRAGRLLVGRVHEAVDEADGARLDPPLGERPGGRPHLVLGQRHDRLALVVGLLGHPPAVGPGDQRRGWGARH